MSDLRRRGPAPPEARARPVVAERDRSAAGRLGAAWQAVTVLGRFVIGVVIAGVGAGLAFGWVEGWFVSLLGALVLATAVPFLLGSRAYRATIALSRAHVVAGGEAGLEVHVENTARRAQSPAVAELPVGPALHELAVPRLRPRERVDLPAAVPAPKRGVIAVGPLTLVRRDPLGMFARGVTWPERHVVHVHPVTVGLPPNSAGMVRDLEGRASRRLSDADLSFHAVREYAPGDAVRSIHWKSTAKTGTLMVRQFEESQTARTAVLFDAVRAEYASGAEFELAVSAAASLSVHAVREGRERFVASAWARDRARPRVDGLHELPSREPVGLLDAWAELDPVEDGPRFEVLARRLADSRRRLSVVVVVTGSEPGLARLSRAAVGFAPDDALLSVKQQFVSD
ncbi:MAG: DUF58 domain-containing protein [Leucobacter sp.]|nr:DUF58 domain-containing protein [Leucobacter sp.]